MWNKIKQWADEAAIAGVSIAVGVAIGLGIAIALLLPKAYDAATKGPDIPLELIDHQADARGDLPRSSDFGATPSKAYGRPSSWLEDRGIKYFWKGSPNWSGRGAGNPIEAIVIHVTGPGSMAGMDSWFGRPESQVSAHFGIGKDGNVHQYVEVADVAWHAGIYRVPDLTQPLVNKWFTNTSYVCRDRNANGVVDRVTECLNESRPINPNSRTIGIELLLAGPAEPLKNYPLMRESLDQLLIWIAQEVGITLDTSTVLGHYQIDSQFRASDPVCCLQLRDLVPEANPRGPLTTPTGLDFGACNKYNQRWTEDVQIKGKGTWWPGGWKLGWAAATRAFDTVPPC